MLKDLTNYDTSYDTERLTLQTLTHENMSGDYLKWLTDPEIVQYLEIRHSTQTDEKIREYVDEMYQSENNLLLGIFLKDGKKHIGNIKLGPVVRRYYRGDVGIIIGDKDSWGHGYATESIKAVSAIAEGIGFKKLQAGAYESNNASTNAFFKAGYEQEGLIKNHWIRNDKPEALVWLGKVL